MNDDVKIVLFALIQMTSFLWSPEDVPNAHYCNLSYPLGTDITVELLHARHIF